MGFDLNIFVDRVDEELMCCICTDVLEDPIQLIPCQHLYCRHCLVSWLAIRANCPVDDQPVGQNNVSAVPRCIQNMLSKLKVRCDRCQQVMPLPKYRSHNCFQEILSQMGDYIQQIDDSLLVLEVNKMKIS